jgi:hypothetical protein
VPARVVVPLAPVALVPAVGLVAVPVVGPVVPAGAVRTRSGAPPGVPHAGAVVGTWKSCSRSR